MSTYDGDLVEAAYDDLRCAFGDTWAAPAFADLWADEAPFCDALWARAWSAADGETDAERAVPTARAVARSLICLGYPTAADGVPFAQLAVVTDGYWVECPGDGFAKVA